MRDPPVNGSRNAPSRVNPGVRAGIGSALPAIGRHLKGMAAGTHSPSLRSASAKPLLGPGTRVRPRGSHSAPGTWRCPPDTILLVRSVARSNSEWGGRGRPKPGRSFLIGRRRRSLWVVGRWLSLFPTHSGARPCTGIRPSLDVTGDG